MCAFKAEAIRLIEQLPDGSDWVDATYQFYIRAQIEEGLAAARAGQVVSHEQVAREMKEWLAPLGRHQHNPNSDES